jgi:hypothetical protein
MDFFFLKYRFNGYDHRMTPISCADGNCYLQASRGELGPQSSHMLRLVRGDIIRAVSDAERSQLTPHDVATLEFEILSSEIPAQKGKCARASIHEHELSARLAWERSVEREARMEVLTDNPAMGGDPLYAELERESAGDPDLDDPAGMASALSSPKLAAV